uniref:Uncharacterized protein n=1 Tax=Leersia perrieri TaxID=77586 RepID=A0A0D9VZS0_9ORYZ
MEKKKLICLVVALLLCAGAGHGLRILHDVDGDNNGQGFIFGSKSAAAAEAEPMDPSLDDYEEEISHVEFEPETGAPPYAAAGTAATAPAPGPAAAEAMKWWLPPSTIPSFPLFPNPGMPGIGIPLPGIAFKPIGWGSSPATPAPPPPSGAGGTDPSAAANQIIT